MDKHTPEQRRRNMQAVKSKDTKIERKLRLALYHRGYRYRKNFSGVFGCPDIIFVKEKIAVFCDSEFWHGKDWTNRKTDFKSKQEFWIPKIERNIERDKEVTSQLEKDGYLVLRYWGKEICQDLEIIANEIEQAILARRKVKVEEERCE